MTNMTADRSPKKSRDERQMKLQNDKWVGICDAPRYEAWRREIREAYCDLEFDPEPHRYTLHGRELPPVTEVCKQFQEPFDEEAMALHTYSKYHNDPRSRYYRASVEDIKRMWQQGSEAACRQGTAAHEFGEACFWFMTGHEEEIPADFRSRLVDGCLQPQNALEEAIVTFWNDMPRAFVPILCETRVCSEDYGYAGTFDLLCYYDAPGPQQSGFVIFDYKTNRELFGKCGNRHLLPPFQGLLDQDIALYGIQLSLYQLALQPVIPNVRARRIVWLRPTGLYEKHTLPDHTQTLAAWLGTSNP